MPYKNIEDQREYNRKWIAKRKADWFSDKKCVKCFTRHNLELDHVDPSQKLSHSIWSWADEKRQAELFKCQVLCNECHIKKSRLEKAIGINSGSAKLRELDVKYIRELHNLGHPIKAIAREYSMNRNTIRSVIRQETWVHIV